jgi:hypothetical protein
MDQNRENPALQQEPIGEPAAIIAPRTNESLFMWIKSTGRFMPRKSDNIDDEKHSNELDDILDQEDIDKEDADE